MKKEKKLDKLYVNGIPKQLKDKIAIEAIKQNTTIAKLVTEVFKDYFRKGKNEN